MHYEDEYSTIVGYSGASGFVKEQKSMFYLHCPKNNFIKLGF